MSAWVDPWVGRARHREAGAHPIRNHNGYLLRCDGEGLLFDPGEGTQRQFLLADIPASSVTRLCLTHFHGDHCLGVPGTVQRLSVDGVRHAVWAYFPASGRKFFARLRHACVFHDVVDLREEPVEGDGPVAEAAFGVLEARRLDHSINAIGYRLVESDGRRFVPELLACHGVAGPAVSELQRAGSIRAGGRSVRLPDVSEPRRGSGSRSSWTLGCATPPTPSRTECALEDDSLGFELAQPEVRPGRGRCHGPPSVSPVTPTAGELPPREVTELIGKETEL